MSSPKVMLHIIITLCCFVKSDTYLYSVCVIVKQQHSRACHLLGLHHSLQISQQTHVFGHVSSQDLKKEREKKIPSSTSASRQFGQIIIYIKRFVEEKIK